MGSVTVPGSGTAYVDANVLIYTVEKHPLFGPILRPLWAGVDAGCTRAVTSELALLETLVGPYRSGATQLACDYEAFLGLGAVDLLPITQGILREAARLRAASPALRAPDAIHAATALLHGVTCFVTNDSVFRAVRGLDVVLLREVETAGAHP